jgi:beta-glucosidase
MPWIGAVSGVFAAWYPGIGGGEAIADLLFGVVNPSAKLPITFAKEDADLPNPRIPGMTPDNKPRRELNKDPHSGFVANYPEGLAVGYRWFEVQHREPLFAFGQGLSYTSFKYSDLAIDNKSHTVSFRLANSGKVPGTEVAQVYVTLPSAAGEPFQRLAGWQRVTLAPNQARTVTIVLDPAWISMFDVTTHGWKFLSGDYGVSVGGSSKESAVKGSLRVP